MRFVPVIGCNCHPARFSDRDRCINADIDRLLQVESGNVLFSWDVFDYLGGGERMDQERYMELVKRKVFDHVLHQDVSEAFVSP